MIITGSTIVIILLSIIVLLLGFTTLNLLRKNEKAEDIVVGYLTYLDQISRVIEAADIKIKKIDIKGSFVVVKTKEGNQSYHESDLIALNKEGESVPLDLPMLEEDEVTEAEFKGKDVQLNKPKRGGSKKFYVYVKNPKTKRVKKVSFGAAGGGQSLKVKIRDSKARKAFAARHRCSSKKDRTSSGYWSCNLPRYAQALGLGANMNTFW